MLAATRCGCQRSAATVAAASRNGLLHLAPDSITVHAWRNHAGGDQSSSTPPPPSPPPKGIQNDDLGTKLRSYFYPNTDVGIKERSIKPQKSQPDPPLQTPYPPFPGGKNPSTGEVGGPTGPEPTRFGDWERKGRVTDF